MHKQQRDWLAMQTIEGLARYYQAGGAALGLSRTQVKSELAFRMGQLWLEAAFSQIKAGSSDAEAVDYANQQIGPGWEYRIAQALKGDWDRLQETQRTAGRHPGG